MTLDGRRLAGLVLANAFVAWLLTQLSVARVEHLHVGLAGLWTALAVAGATGAVAVAVLRRDEQDPTRRWIPVVALLAAAMLGTGLARAQVGVHNAELVRTLIPLQSEAIRACQAAAVTAPDLVAWCDRMVVEREREIWELQRILRRY